MESFKLTTHIESESLLEFVFAVMSRADSLLLVASTITGCHSFEIFSSMKAEGWNQTSLEV